MKAPVSIATLTLCLLTFGCTKDSSAAGNPAEEAATEQSGNDCEGCIDTMTTVVTKHEDSAVTKGFSLGEFTPISAILADREAFEGKRVKVKGEAVSLCAKRGCFVNLKSDKTNDKTLRVKVEDNVIIFPITIKSHELIVEGVIEKVIIPVEVLHKVYAERAEAKGETFDPSDVTEPLTNWQLKGIAAKCPATNWES